MASDLENLPDDLKELVAGDNKVFAEEIEKWDRDVARKASGAGDADVTIVSEQKPGKLQCHYIFTDVTIVSEETPGKSQCHYIFQNVKSHEILPVILFVSFLAHLFQRKLSYNDRFSIIVVVVVIVIIIMQKM
jgi:hypothetical protein